jgi:dGTPase
MALKELATFAVSSDESKGRVYKEAQADYRNEFQRDRDRIIHCSAFRRLEYKTQVFVNHEGDMFRTRLTHSIEVAQIGRTIARALNVNEDLTEAICLAHDLGHTPFGHAGQDALNNCMKDFGGFEHNLQSLRIVDVLEERYPNFLGLNLTYETREGILKHCSKNNAVELGELGERFIKNYQPSLEAQIANIADEIAYNNHDIDDGLRANLLNNNSLNQSELFEENFKVVVKKWKPLTQRQIRHEVVRRMINYIVSDLIENSKRLIQNYNLKDINAVRKSKKSLIKMSKNSEKKHNDLKRILRKELYEHEQVKRMTLQAKKTIQCLFDTYIKNPNFLTNELHERIKENIKSNHEKKNARIVADYIAGMTDRFALSEYRRISDER